MIEDYDDGSRLVLGDLGFVRSMSSPPKRVEWLRW